MWHTQKALSECSGSVLFPFFNFSFFKHFLTICCERDVTRVSWGDQFLMQRKLPEQIL